jgi:hypothetical protein
MQLNNKALAALILSFSVLGGCSGTGDFQQSTDTSVSLERNNYKLIKSGAVGRSSGFKLLGIIPIVSPSYAEAKRDLYQSAGQTLEGRSIALANQTQDKSSLYLVLFSIPTITFSADIVEFKDE